MTAAAASTQPYRFTVASNYRVIASDSPVVGAAVGKNLWTVFPGSEEAFGFVYDAARELGEASACVMYAGAVTQLAVKFDGVFTVEYQNVDRFDVTTLRTLHDSLARHAARLAAAAAQTDPAGEPEASSSPLRLVL